MIILILNPCGETHIQAAAGTRSRRGYNVRPDLAKFTQLRVREPRIAERDQLGGKRRKSAAVWVIAGEKCQI